MIREKHHRLQRELYRGFCTAAFTLCLKERQSFFTTEPIFNHLEKLLLDTLSRYHVSAEIYLFIPDHLHLLLRGTDETADVYKVCVAFKQQSGFWFSNEHPDIHWQKDFYDHILHTDENLRKHIQYILNNPVRKELVSDWIDYPFKGSTVHNFDEW